MIRAMIFLTSMVCEPVNRHLTRKGRDFLLSCKVCEPVNSHKVVDVYQEICSKKQEFELKIMSSEWPSDEYDPYA